MTETPNTVHGRLLEAVHISGYTMERACSELDWLLDEDRWKTVAGGFDDIKAFLGTIDLSEFKIAIERRQKLARRLDQIEASQRDIAKALGVSQATILRDLEPFGSDREKKASKTNDAESPSEPNGSPAWFQANTDPAELSKKAAEHNALLAERAEIAKQKAARAIVEPSGKFRVILADPPWSYGNTQPDYHTEQRDHYPVMPLEAICNEPVREKYAEDDAVLFLWVTSPILEEAFEVIQAWGFRYKATFVWDKIKHNMGHYNSVRHEFLLICTRGSCQPDVRKLFDSVISIERTEHSRKPDCVYEIIETLYTHGRRLEMYLRGSPRPGWEGYGYEASHG